MRFEESEILRMKRHRDRFRKTQPADERLNQFLHTELIRIDRS